MTGSDKQIAWATEILNIVNPALDWCLANCPEAARPEWQAIKEKINNAYAGNIITCFRGIKRAYHFEGINTLVYDDDKTFAAVRNAYLSYQKISLTKF